VLTLGGFNNRRQMDCCISKPKNTMLMRDQKKVGTSCYLCARKKETGFHTIAIRDGEDDFLFEQICEACYLNLRGKIFF
jgi:hypothetical protein